MKALQLVQPGTFVELDVPIPALPPSGPEYLLIKTYWDCLCGSDIPFFKGSKRYEKFPLAVGAENHECVGEVVDSQSSRFTRGDIVVAIPEGDKALAEYFVALASQSVKLPDSLANCDASPLIQPLSTVINALDRLGDVSGKTCAVVGLGAMGLFFCSLLKERGAKYVTGIDPIQGRCLVARSMGADQTFTNRSIEVVHLIHQPSTAWVPPDICIEAVGHQMDTLNDCLELVKKYGTVLAFGVPDLPIYAIEYELFLRKNIHLVGVITPEWAPYMEKACKVFCDHQTEFTALVTHRFPLRQAQDAYQLYSSRQDGVIKVILNVPA